MNQTLFVTGMVIYGIFNALNDPFLGNWSDQVDVNKWGSRRAIFIRYGGPIWALFFFLMWFPWSYENQIIIFIEFIVMLVLYDNMLTMVILVWDALLPEIAENIQERNRIFFLGNLIGTIGGIPVLFSLNIINLGQQALHIYTGIIGIISSIIFYVSGSRIKEKLELLRDKDKYNVIESLKQCLSSKSFVSFTFYRFCGVVNDTMIYSFIFLYALLFSPGFEVIILVLLGIGGMIGQLVYLRWSKGREMQTLIMRGRVIEISIRFPLVS